MNQIFGIVFTIGFIASVAVSPVQAQKLGNSFGASIGYWKPSLEEANDLLELWAETLEDADITPSGDDKFNGNLTLGGMFTIGLAERAAIRAEVFYWKKTIEQTAREVEEGSDYLLEFDGEASASVRIIPIVVSGLYYFGDVAGNVRPYFGGGLGLAFTSAEVEANARA